MRVVGLRRAVRWLAAIGPGVGKALSLIAVDEPSGRLGFGVIVFLSFLIVFDGPPFWSCVIVFCRFWWD